MRIGYIRNVQGEREFDMPFLNGDSQEVFQLNKTRSMALLGCWTCKCLAHCCKSCAGSCCNYDNDFSNLSGMSYII